MTKPIRIIDGRNKEKFQIDDFYLDHYAKMCGWNATLVYLCLCRHADSVTQESFPSIEMMAEKVGVSYNTIRRGIKILTDWGIIEVRRDKNEAGQWLRNTYKLLDKSTWKQVHSPDRAMEVHSPVATKVHSPVVITKDTHTDNDTHSERLSANTSSNNTNNGKSLKAEVAFEAVWSLYPSAAKKGKKAALRAWKGSVKSPEDEVAIKRALENYKAEIARNRTEDKYIKHGGTWFNNWQDYVQVGVNSADVKPQETNAQKIKRMVCPTCKGKIEQCDDLWLCNQCNGNYTDQVNKVKLELVA